ncbi:MAG: hypothetical protein H7A33_02485 [Deltaproteobacteria bacterium]|nr:hypothetical protein [Deltaproteobacteria bacterium]
MKSRYLFLTLLFLLPAAVGFSKGRPTPDGITPKTSTDSKRDFDRCRPNQVIAKVDILDLGDSVADCFADTIDVFTHDFEVRWSLQRMEEILAGEDGPYFVGDGHRIGFNIHKTNLMDPIIAPGIKLRLDVDILVPKESADPSREPGKIKFMVTYGSSDPVVIDSIVCGDEYAERTKIETKAFDLKIYDGSYEFISVETEGNCPFTYYGAELIKQ